MGNLSSRTVYPTPHINSQILNNPPQPTNLTQPRGPITSSSANQQNGTAFNLTRCNATFNQIPHSAPNVRHPSNVNQSAHQPRTLTFLNTNMYRSFYPDYSNAPHDVPQHLVSAFCRNLLVSEELEMQAHGRLIFFARMIHIHAEIMNGLLTPSATHFRRDNSTRERYRVLLCNMINFITSMRNILNGMDFQPE